MKVVRPGALLGVTRPPLPLILDLALLLFLALWSGWWWVVPADAPPVRLPLVAAWQGWH